MESLSGTAVSSTVAIVGSIWPKGPAQAGPATQAQCSLSLRNTLSEDQLRATAVWAPSKFDHFSQKLYF